MDRQIIDIYEAGGRKLADAVRGFSRQDFLAVPILGKWSTQQVVLHLMDAEMAFADRMKRVIAEENPPLLAWDENRFAANLHYEDQSAEDAALLVRRQLAAVLRKLPDEAFDRSGTHNVRGPQTLAKLIEFDNWHLDHHLKFIAEKRAKLGK